MAMLKVSDRYLAMCRSRVQDLISTPLEYLDFTLCRTPERDRLLYFSYLLNVGDAITLEYLCNLESLRYQIAGVALSLGYTQKHLGALKGTGLGDTIVQISKISDEVRVFNKKEELERMHEKCL